MLSLINPTILITSFEDVPYILKTPIKHKLIMYMYDMDWYINNDFEENYNFVKERVDELYCRSEEHAIEIERFCGIKPKVVKEFNLEELFNGNESR